MDKLAKRKKEIGKVGEEIVARFLQEKGYEILARNYSKPRWGEIDIITKYNNCIYFIEVRTRTNKCLGDPIESVNSNKLKSVQNTINHYIYHNFDNNEQYAWKFEIYSVYLDLLRKRSLLTRYEVYK